MGDVDEAGGEREREREICKLHKFVVEQRPQGEIQHDARAAECLGRSVGPSFGGPAANRAFNVASLFVLLLPVLPLSSFFPPVRCLLSVYRGRKRSLVGRCGRSVPRPSCVSAPVS